MNDAPPPRVRPATAADRAAVLAFCQGTFAWGDYIAEVWDEWLGDPTGRLLVAEVAGAPVAVGHARLLGDGSAWLEGLRVHPDHRRRGIADAMNAAGCDWARAAGAFLARLATDVENEPALRQVARLGFRPVADFDYWVAKSAESASEAEIDIAKAADHATLPAAWSESALTEASGGLIAQGWQWRGRTEDALRIALAEGRVLVAGPACGLLDAVPEETRLTWLAGPTGAWATLLGAIRQLARRAGHRQAVALLPGHPALAAAARGAGFEREGCYRILARPL